MHKHNNKKLTALFRDLDLGDITESKKLFLLDEINALLTHRIVTKLIEKTTDDKKELFIGKINEYKDDPNKILLYIDHFVEDADKIIDREIATYKKELIKTVKGKSKGK